MWLLIPVLITLHVAVCLLLVLIVLMQLPRSEGLGAAFGGAVTENIFGAQTTHVLARFTVWLGVAFFAITLALAMAYSRLGTGTSKLTKELTSAPVPVEAASPTPTPAAAATPAVEGATTPAPTATPAPVETVAPVATPTPAAAATP